MAPPALAALLVLAASPTSPAEREAAVSAALAAAPAGGPRAAAATAPLHGLPYLEDPLGEAAGEDPDPRFRLDAFDCMTFAETAVALGGAAGLDEARARLDALRYRGPPALSHRNHEVLSQWLPWAVAGGFVAPASRAAAGSATLAASASWDAPRWRRLARLGRSLRGVPPDQLPIGRFRVELVPPEALAAAGPAIADGTLAFVVREDWRDLQTPVTHVGLVVVGRGGTRLVRHATSSAGVRRVIEEPLDRYVERQRRASRRPVLGFALYEILPPSGPVRPSRAPRAPDPPRPGWRRSRKPGSRLPVP